MKRLLSRKFILAAIGQITGLAVLIYPDHAGPIEQAATHVGALLLMALSALGYISGESKIDAERVRGEKAKETARESNGDTIASLQRERDALADQIEAERKERL